MPNAEPPEKVSLRLFIDAGSLMEEEDQQGIAHFLEHLAFNGSKHFPEGNLVEYFQRIGMGFGADTNAHTSFNETVYKLELPKNDDATLDDGFQLFRDFADGLLLESDEIDKERGVILSEKRSRDSVQQRIFEAELNFVLPKALPPKRLPIGDEEVIQSVPRKRFLDFYRDWYVPNRMAIIVVGDVKPEKIIPLLEKHFSSLSAPAHSRNAPDMGEAFTKGVAVKAHYESEAPNTTVSLQTMRPYEPELDSVAKRKKDLFTYIATHILNRRFEVLAKKKGAPFMRASAYSHDFLDFAKNAGVEISCKPGQWEKALQTAEHELRKALTYGFTAGELEEAKVEMLNLYEQALKTAPTRKSRGLARLLVQSVGDDNVFTSPKSDFENVKSALQELTLKEALNALRETWPDYRNGLYIFISGNAQIKVPEKTIAAAYQKSLSQAVVPPEEKARQAFAYTNFGKPGEILSKQYIQDLDITQTIFKNNVRLNVKQTAFEKNDIRVSVRFGGGSLDAPKEKPGLSELTSMTFMKGGLVKHSSDEIKSIFASKSVETTFHVDGDAFVLSGSAAPEDLRDLLQLMTAYVIAPGYREEAFRQAKKHTEALYPRLRHTPKGILMSKVKKLLASGDFRFGFPEEKVFLNRTAEETRQWLEKPLASSYMEISIVGDLNMEKSIGLVQDTFGALPTREKKKPSYQEERIVKFPRDLAKKTLFVDTEIPKAMVTAFWPTGDILDIQRTRRLHVLSSIFTDRLRLKVREETGESYSPRASHEASKVYTDYGLFSVAIVAKPEQTERLASLTLEIAQELATKGVTPDELQRALKPVLNGLKDWVRNNNYWLNTVLDASQEYPKRLEWSRTMTKDYSSVKLEDMNSLAKKYLSPENALVVTLIPKKTEKKEK